MQDCRCLLFACPQRENCCTACLSNGVRMRMPPFTSASAWLVRRGALAGRAARRTLGAIGMLAFLATPAHAVSVADIEQLSRAGLGDEVLIALIQTDNTVFPLDAERILELRAAGVSEQVIIAMLRNGRSAPPNETHGTSVGPNGSPDGTSYAPDGTPYVAPNFSSAPSNHHSPDTVYDDPTSGEVPPAPVVVQVQQPPPAVPVVYMPYPVVVGGQRGASHGAAVPPPYRGFGRFINNGWVDHGGSHRTSP